jgi:hypothetical protein
VGTEFTHNEITLRRRRLQMHRMQPLAEWHRDTECIINRKIGTFAYHFWMFDMKARRRNDGNQHLHRASPKYRDDVKRKLHAYHVFIQTGLICQGLLQYLSVAHPRLVWASFGSWLRTVRPGIPPSELVVATALRQRLPEFLLDTPKGHIFTKFLAKRADTNKMQGFQLAA